MYKLSVRLFLGSCLIAVCYAGYGQGRGASIKGTVIDSASGEVLDMASVILIRRKDTAVIRQVFSGATEFDLRHVPAGSYWLLTSFIGYRRDTLALVLNNVDSVYHIEKIRLAVNANNLMEVVIKSVIPPVIVKSDTMVYRAGAYKTPPNATVEDLLRKLPGIEIDKDGNVTMQGKKVEKIYIDGKEFFLSDLKTATENLTADMVDAIEIFDDQSDRAKFTGVKDMDVNKAINLRLKKKKAGLFGNASATAGTKRTYRGAATATYFETDRWIFGEFNAGQQDNLTPDAGQKQYLSSSALSYRDSLGKKALLVANYGGGNTRNKMGHSTARETFLGDSTQTQNSVAFNNNRSSGQTFDGKLTYNIDSSVSIVYTPSLSMMKNNALNSDSSSLVIHRGDYNYIINQGNTSNSIFAHGMTLDNNVTLQKRFKKAGRTLYAVLTQGINRQNEDGKLYSSLRLYDSSGILTQNRITDQEYHQLVHGNTVGANISYTEPLKANQIIDVRYDFSTSFNSSDKHAFNYNDITGKYDRPDTLTTDRFKNYNTEQRFEAGYNYLGKKVQYQVGLSALYSVLRSDNDQENYPAIVQDMLNWSPRAAAYFKLAAQKYLRLQYSGRGDAPSVDMLQPIPDLSNPYLINEGNPQLKQQFQHVLNFSYHSSNSKYLSHLSLELGGDYTTNKIVQSSTIIAGGIQQLQYINVDGAYHVKSGVYYGFSLGQAKYGNGELAMNLQYGRNPNMVNGEPNVQKAWMVSQGFNFNYNVDDKLYSELMGNVSYSHSVYFLSENLNTEQLLQIYRTKVTYLVFAGIRLSSDFVLSVNGKQSSLPETTIAMWNVSAYKNIFRNNRGEIRLSALDLLNNNTGFSQTSGENYIATSESHSVGRYFMLSLRYNFQSNS